MAYQTAPPSAWEQLLHGDTEESAAEVQRQFEQIRDGLWLPSDLKVYHNATGKRQKVEQPTTF